MLKKLPALRPRADAILTGDSLALLPRLPAGCANLVFADPPFNLGLDHPGYDDRRPEDEYLRWLKELLRASARVLAPAGALWLAIDTAHQAEAAVMLKALGLHWRNTIVWHYSFGPCQKKKFTRSWAALHYFVKDTKRFTLNRDAVAVPSARQLAYNDKRARPGGKVPDDVWFVRPQQAEPEGFFDPAGDVWHVRREAGTFKGRVGHVCQMPLPVLERIISATSNPGDLVLDPVCGPGTTLVAAQKLGRKFLGIELCDTTAELARRRLGLPSRAVNLEAWDR
jgi:site-specific DNA-methyltransferase (adenine-specific)